MLRLNNLTLVQASSPSQTLMSMHTYLFFLPLQFHDLLVSSQRRCALDRFEPGLYSTTEGGGVHVRVVNALRNFWLEVTGRSRLPCSDYASSACHTLGS